MGVRGCGTAVAEESEFTHLKIISESGQEWIEREGYVNGDEGEISYVRGGPIDLAKEKYWVVPTEMGEQGEIGPRVPIN